MTVLRGFRDLIVYQKSYVLAMKIFDLTKSFPKEEKYSLSDQIRRSSRSIFTNLSEAWAKRIYPKVFVNKLSDSLGEEYEIAMIGINHQLRRYYDQSGVFHLTRKK